MKTVAEKPRWKKVRTDFSENRSRLILVVASIFIGVFAVGLIMVTLAVLPENLERTYTDANPANITIITDDFDHDFLKMIERIPGVESADGRKTLSVRARVPGGSKWENLQLVAINDPQQMDLKNYEIINGANFQKEGDILILEDALLDFPVTSDDELEIQLPDDAIRSVPIRGIVKDYSAGIELTLNRRIAFIDSDDLAYFHSSPFFTTLILTVSGDVNDIEHIEHVTKQVIDKVEDSGRIVYSQQIQRAQDHPYGNYIDAISVILSFIGVMIVVLSSFLVINTMNSIISEHTRQIGVMKLIGAQARDIEQMYIVLVFLFGLAAFLLAVPASSFGGYILSKRIVGSLNGLLYSTNPFPIIPRAMIVQAMIAFIVPIASAIVPIRRGAKTSVREALHSSLIETKSGNSWINQIIDNFKEHDGVVRLAIRNTFRKKGRLALTLITLSIGGSIFIGVFNVQAMLDQHIQNLTNYCDADVFVTFNQSYSEKEIIPIAESIPGITYVESWQTLSGTFETEFETEIVQIEAPPDDSVLLNAIVQTGRWIEPDESHTIVVNESFYDTFPSMKPGDRIILKIKGKDEVFTIVGIYNHTGLSEKRAYINEKTANELLGSWSSSKSYRLVTEDNSLDSILLMEDQVNETFRDLGYNVGGVFSLEVIVDETGEKVNLLISVLMILAVLTGVVGNIGLSGTLSLNIMDRTSEIGILRAIGADDKTITKLVLYESFFISLVSYVIGAVLSIPISLSLGNMIMGAVFKSQAILTFSPVGYFVWIFLVGIMSIIASRIPARNATKLTIREVLAYE